MSIKDHRLEHLELIDQVESLNEEVRVLALNMAIYLAKVRDESNQLRRLEPDFIRLVNGSVKVVQQLSHVIGAARRSELGATEQTTLPETVSNLEQQLNAILTQCSEIMTTLNNRGHSKLT